MNYIATAMEKAAELVLTAYETAVCDGALPRAEVRTPVIEVPKDLKNGDYATGFAMQNAKILGVNPRKAAEELIARFDFKDTCFASAEVAGPGFINLRLAHKWFEDVLQAIADAKADYGKTVANRPEKIMVEFVSANPTGPMHMGNARGGVLGDTIAEVLSLAGNDVTREFYVNDAGNQIEKFAQSLQARYIQIIKGEENHPFPEDGYHGDDIKELAKSFFELHGDAYMQAPEEQRKAELVKHGLANNLPRMKGDLARYKIGYDN